MHRSTLIVASLLAFGLSAGSAQATIVWDGKEVSAWPDLRNPTVTSSTLNAPPSPLHVFPHPTGTIKGLVMLVDFSDAPATLSKADIDGWLNTKGYTGAGLTGSIRDYFLGQSNGAVDYQNELHGYYRAKKTKAYYDSGTDYSRGDELWSEVVNAMDAEIDFSLFDNNKDGKTDAISLLYAGKEGTWGVGIWPHAASSGVRKDGVVLDRYMMTALGSQPANYVFAHESGHMLFGWPDLYGVGDYCIMGNRGADKNPVGINDVFRVDQGWLDVVDIDKSTNARYSTAPDEPAYRFLNPANNGEYFLWSNVQAKNEWVSLVGGGILLWHFDNSIDGNNPPEVLQLAVVQGGGKRILSATTWPDPGSAATDFFYNGNNSEISGKTKPASKWNNGSESGLRIYDIGANAAQMTFSVGTGTIPADGGVDARPGVDASADVAPDAPSVADSGRPDGLRDGRADTATGGTTATGGKGGTGGTGSDAGAAGSGGAMSSGGGAAGSSGRGGQSGGTSGAAGTATGQGGAAGSGGSGIKASSADSGCSCALVGTSPSPALVPLMFLVALGVALARRRR
jgi:M6 family metalloprotease-like protein/MYXO-CTERM domain-containing protein